MQNLNIDVVELLASKICHDLISPIGAVNNGVEFLEEMGPDAGDEITNLISFSATQASAKLQAFRMAYGAGGADTSIKPEDVHACFALLLKGDDKVALDWDPEMPIGPEDRPPGLCKTLICSLLLALEALPKGGSIHVTTEGHTKIILTSKGEDAGLKPLTIETLAGDIIADELDPKLVHPYMSKLLAKHYKFDLHSRQNDDGESQLIIEYLG